MQTAKRFARKPRIGGLPSYRSIVCPVCHWANRCHKVCTPVEGKGVCGRLAPHALRSYYQEAIDRYKARERRAGSASSP